MHHYLLFGGVLDSEVEFPELQATAPRPPRWSLRCSSAARALPDGEHLGTDVVAGETRVNLYRRADGLRLLFDDTGCFDVSADGSRITWHRPAGASPRDARADLTSRVIAAALYAAGTVCLHGSAVVMDGVAVGFVAPKLHGKSTLALALVRSGARLLTDDTLPILPGAPPVAQPGLHAARLWEDSAARVALGRAAEAAPGGKRLFSGMPEESVTHEGAPLAALYLLAPTREPRGDAAVWRTRLSEIESALLLIGNAKLAPLLAKSEAPVLFEAAAALARGLPAYRLNVVRDLDRLGEAADTIRSWHAPAPVPA